MSGVAVELLRRDDGKFVKAQLVDALEPKDLVLVERGWTVERLKLMCALAGSRAPRTEWPQSLHWDWSLKASELIQLQATGFAVVCGDEWQGVMMTKTATHFARIANEKGKPLVYVDFLEAAPWNWNVPALGRRGRYGGVGSILIREAVKQSVEEGFHGRVGLHALPQAEGFYAEVCGMTLVGRDSDKQDLFYFELGREQARKFLD